MRSQSLSSQPKLVVALDVQNRVKAKQVAESFSGLDIWLKVGLELFTAEGPEVVRMLTSMGFPVFLDMKFHDIPNTVAGAVSSAVATGASILTLHVSGGSAMAKAAVQARNSMCQQLGIKKPPLLLGITVLTSTMATEGTDIEVIVKESAIAAKEYGLDGVVCSGLEAKAVKEVCGNEFICLCPGIRPLGTSPHDQARVCSPLQAAENGADFLVIGRPIMNAENPAYEAQKIYNELQPTL